MAYFSVRSMGSVSEIDYGNWEQVASNSSYTTEEAGFYFVVGLDSRCTSQSNAYPNDATIKVTDRTTTPETVTTLPAWRFTQQSRVDLSGGGYQYSNTKVNYTFAYVESNKEISISSNKYRIYQYTKDPEST